VRSTRGSTPRSPRCPGTCGPEAPDHGGLVLPVAEDEQRTRSFLAGKMGAWPPGRLPLPGSPLSAVSGMHAGRPGPDGRRSSSRRDEVIAGEASLGTPWAGASLRKSDPGGDPRAVGRTADLTRPRIEGRGRGWAPAPRSGSRRATVSSFSLAWILRRNYGASRAHPAAQRMRKQRGGEPHVGAVTDWAVALWWAEA